jgi:hypothetical protein
MESGIEFIIYKKLASPSRRFPLTYWNDRGELRSDVSHASHFRESFMERIKPWILELCIVEAKKVVHDDISGQGWECMGQIQWLLSPL